MSLCMACCQLTFILIGTYERALKEQESVDVAYARLMLLGSAGTGKTCLKRSLMEQPFDPHTTSTIVSDVSTVRPSEQSTKQSSLQLSERPFGHEQQTLSGNKWREVTPEDKIEELAYLFKSCPPSFDSDGAKSSIDKPIVSSARQSSKVKNSIELMLSKVNFIQTAELAQVSYYFVIKYLHIILVAM